MSAIWKHGVVAMGLVAFYLALEGSTWLGSTELHTNIEIAASIVSFVVGLVALIRFYSKKNNTSLFVGAGFLGTALLDWYHAIVTSSFFDQLFPSPAPSLIPWSWNASRTFLALLMLLSYWAWDRERRLGKAGRVSEFKVYAGVASLTLISFAFFAFVPLPAAYYPELPFGRPEEFVAATLFLLALVGHLKKGAWRTDALENSLVVSLMIGFASQALFMSRSYGLFDAMFDAAHALKLISYVVVFIGLQVNTFQLFRLAEQSAADLAALNESLASERNLLRALTDNLPDFIFVKNTRSQFITTNSAHIKALGADSVDEVVGKTDFDFMPYQQAGRHYKDEQTVMKSGNILRDAVEQTIDPRGNPCWRMTTKVPLKNEQGVTIGLVGISRDITELQQAMGELKAAKALSDQQAAELSLANEELQQFSNVAAHDLQEPLRSLVAYSTLLREDLPGELSDDAATDLTYIQTAASRMQRLISDLLDYSRTGRTAINCVAVSIDACVDESLEVLRSQLEKSGARIERQELPTVIGDPMLLTQLYQNLISNALKFSHEVDPVVELTAERGSEGWTLGVRDNGIGLDPKYAEQIFRPFKRLHGSTEYSGTGIGLAICRKSVDRHGGKIWVESQPHEGAHFKFSFPHPPHKMENA